MRHLWWNPGLPLAGVVVIIALVALGCAPAATPTAAPTAAPKAEPKPAAAEPAKPAATQPAPAAAKPAEPAAKPAASEPATKAAQPSGDVVKFGVLLDYTGSGAPYSLRNWEGVEMAINDINGAGGIDVGGKKVKIEVAREDTASDRAAGVALLKKIAVQQDILAIIGPSATNLLIGMAPVCEENKMVCMATGSAAPWKEFNDYTFRNNIISGITVPKVIKELKDKYDLKTMAITYDTANDFSVGDKGVAEQTAKELSLNVTAIESYRTGDTDFSSQITKILPGRSDLWWLAGTANEDILLIRQARQRGYKGIIAGGPNVTDPIIFKNSEGMAQGVVTFFPLDLQSPRPEVQKFIKDYQAAHSGTQPSSFVALGYDAVVLFADAVKRAGTVTDRQKFRDALGAAKGVTGIQGSYTYNGKGDNQTPSFSLQVMDQGKFVPLRQYQGELRP